MNLLAISLLKINLLLYKKINEDLLFLTGLHFSINIEVEHLNM